MKNVINNKYRGWWELLDYLPDGWIVDKKTDSPLNGYYFITDNQPIKGCKRALFRIKKQEKQLELWK